jgi:oligosaccharide repeat unit polymerase
MSLLGVSDLSISAVCRVDIFVLVICTILLYKYGRLTSAHPGFIYLVFHGMFFTGRLFAVLSGSETLFSDWPGALPVSDQEVAHAGLFADMALVGMTVGLLLSSQRDRKKKIGSFSVGETSATLSTSIVRRVSAMAFPIGIVSLLVGGAVPSAANMAVNFGQWDTSSWLMITQFWPILVLLALIYLYGVRWMLTIPLGMLLLLMSIQGFNRFRVILPAIFLLITWQTRTGRKWPQKWMVVLLICLTMLTFSMKTIGWMVQRGDPLSDVIPVVEDSFSTAISGSSPDQMFLDMFAATMWLVDGYGHYFYGTTIYPLLFLPIPRQLWPEKPSISQYLYEIRDPLRPIYWAGMGGTMLGEAYANFGPFGVVIVPCIIGYCLGRFYFSAMRRPYYSVCRFMYVTVGCCLVQVFRDGLQSAVVFPLVDMMPLVAIALLSYFSFRRRVTRNFDQTKFNLGSARSAIGERA